MHRNSFYVFAPAVDVGCHLDGELPPRHPERRGSNPDCQEHRQHTMAIGNAYDVIAFALHERVVCIATQGQIKCIARFALSCSVISPYTSKFVSDHWSTALVRMSIENRSSRCINRDSFPSRAGCLGRDGREQLELCWSGHRSNQVLCQICIAI